MGLKSDNWIRMMAAEHRMIDPFMPGLISQAGGNEKNSASLDYPGHGFGKPRKLISFGTSSYGYDLRCSDDFKIFTNIGATIVDPKAFDEKNVVDFKGDICVIPPNSFALAKTVEYFRIPRKVQTIIIGKSTYARCGIILNCTPAEPEWEGYLTLEISNTTPLPARVYAWEGIGQMLFFEADDECETSYKDRKGKYDKQTELTLAKV